MDIPKSLLDACLVHGETIKGLNHNFERVHGGRLLLAIAGLESSFGKQRLHVRYEPGYGPGGVYYRNRQTLRDRWKTYGVLSASSYGSFQVMYITAEELGFSGHPIELQDDFTCAKFAAKLITDRFMGQQKLTMMTQILDAYNSGNAKDAIVPIAYVNKGVELYKSLDSI